MLSPRLHHFLDERHAPYETLNHPRTITAQETANAAHIGNLMGALKVEFPGTQNQRFSYGEFAEQFRQQFGYAL
jgi:hypothetical protein